MAIFVSIIQSNPTVLVVHTNFSLVAFILSDASILHKLLETALSYPLREGCRKKKPVKSMVFYQTGGGSRRVIKNQTSILEKYVFSKHVDYRVDRRSCTCEKQTNPSNFCSLRGIQERLQ